MDSFLGVPITVRGSVFGNLYLAGRRHGDFTEDDQELIRAVAGTAAVAIENARLYDEARRRERWLQATAEVTQQLLSYSGEDPLTVIARSVQELADADLVTVVLPAAASGELMVEVAIGLGADRIIGMSYPTEHSVAGAVIEASEPVLIDDIEQQSEYTLHMREIVPVNAVIGLPLVGSIKSRGCLLVARLTGRRGFTQNDLQMASTFANHAAVALELADARSYQQRMVLLEDRDRIARDLHDHVIQRLFAAGLTVQSLQARQPEPAAASKLGQVVTDLDDTIRQIRTSIFDLRGALSPVSARVRTQLLAVAAEQAAHLGFEPTLRFCGPVDSAVSSELTAELTAVLREALSNVARHAHASSVEVTLDVASGQLCLSIADDGIGLRNTSRRSGLANLNARAVRHGGSLTVASSPEDGTQLQWQIPLS
jgi:signal transduction histidine kinase